MEIKTLYDTMENKEDRINRIGKVLEFFRVVGKPVHIRVTSGPDAGLFRNGHIIHVDEDKREFIIVDMIVGNRNYSFYEIAEKIFPYRSVKK